MLNRRQLLRSGVALGAGAALSQAPLFPALAQETTLRLYWWGSPNRAERTESVARLFEGSRSGVKINGEVNGTDYWPKLTTMLAGGSAPDVYQMEPGRFADYSRRGAALQLDPYLGSTIRTDRLTPGALGLVTVDGKVTGMPMAINAYALIYDTKVFADAGIAPPSATTTWDEFARLSIDLTKAIGKKNVWAVANGGRYNYAFQAFLAQRGKQLYDVEGRLAFDAADAEAWYAYWVDLAAAGGCTSAEIQALDKMQIDSNPLTTGNAVMAIAFSNQLNAYQDVSQNPLGITTLPVADKAGPSGLFYRPSLTWCVANTSQTPELAAQFVDFFINDVEAGKALGVERGVPINLDVREAITSKLSEVEAKSVEYVSSIADRVGTYPPPVPLGASEFDRSAFRPLADKVAFGQVTPAEAAAELIAQGERILKS